MDSHTNNTRRSRVGPRRRATAFGYFAMLCASACSPQRPSGADGGSTLETGGGDSIAVGADTLDAGATSPRTRIYVALVSHNEESLQSFCTADFTQRDGYLLNRSRTLAFARMVLDHGAAWDLQSDWLYLEGVGQWDTGSVTANTGGQNLIAYLASLAPNRIVVDAHSHESRYNYADVAHLIENLGAPRTGVTGGFIYYPTANEVWTRLESPLAGVVFPSVTWTADILWGAGTYLHLGPDSHVSGIWRPRDAQRFHEDDPARRLVNVGGYTGLVGVNDLLQRLRAGTLLPGHMYTVTIFFNQCTLTDTTAAEQAAVVDAWAADVAAGNLVWATLPDMVRIWRQEYGSIPTILQADSAPDGGFDAGPPDGLPPFDGGTCSSGGSCATGTVCCAAPLPCTGRCVPDCRIDGGVACPTMAPVCDTTSGLCVAALGGGG